MKILHITDASAAGVLSSVTALARSQASCAEVDHVRVCYTPRPESPAHADIAAGLGPEVGLERWSATPRTAGLGLVRGLVRELRGGDADLVHLHSSRAGFLGRVFAAVLGTRSRIVYSPHGFAFSRSDYSAPLLAVFLRLERLALTGGRSLVLVSESEAETARARLPRIRSAVLPNAVDLTAFAPAADSAPADSMSGNSASGNSASGDGPPERLGVVHLGRIMAQKDPGAFARIAARAEQIRPGRFAFTWIGDGDRALLTAAEGGEGVQIEITGWVDRREVRDRLARAGIVLFTSRGEGMPMSLLEAHATGVPVVGADVAGVRDIIADGDDGRLFSTDAEAVEALVWMLDAEHRRRCTAAAGQRVRRDHDHVGLGSRSLAVYRRLGEAPITPRTGRAVHAESRRT